MGRGTVKVGKVGTPSNAIRVFWRTHLVMMRCNNKDNWPFSGDVEGTSGTYFSEEDTRDDAPEDEGSLVGQV